MRTHPANKNISMFLLNLSISNKQYMKARPAQGRAGFHYAFWFSPSSLYRYYSCSPLYLSSSFTMRSWGSMMVLTETPWLMEATI